MPSFPRLLARLPSLYRPDEGEGGLLTAFLQSAAATLDDLDREAAQVLQSHWFAYADRALYHPVVTRRRVLAGLPMMIAADLVDALDPVALVTALQADAEAVSGYLRTRFSAPTLLALDAADPAVPPLSLQRRLIDELTRLALGPSIFDETRFAAVSLSDETLALIAENPAGPERIALNVRLLAEAYPGVMQAARQDHTYVHDLARLGALLSLPPWQEPPRLRETVEDYRFRLAQMTALVRNGLGTPAALRRIIDAFLPDPTEGFGTPFWLEEGAPLVADEHQAVVPGEPGDRVGPLMRWSVTNGGLAAVLPTVFIQGLTPEPGVIDAAENPVIERYDGGRFPLALAFEGTVTPDEVLRLRPAFSSWIGRDNGVSRARARPTESDPADPTAPGPWTRVDGTPDAAVRALVQTEDRFLWVAVDNAGVGELWRYDGRVWARRVDGLAPPHCLAESDGGLLFGTDDGLFRLALYTEANPPPPTPLLTGQAVHALLQDGEVWWGATSNGLVQLLPDDTVQPFGVHTDFGTGVVCFALYRDPDGSFFFGTALGLFSYQPRTGHWYWFAGGSASDADLDWQRFDLDASGRPTALPAEAAVFLPPVRALHRSADASLWLGTDRGPARYRARSVRGLTYETVLEAFPDFTSGPVFALAEDARRLLWFCTDRGLLRFDGRDLWESRTDGWKHHGHADLLYDPLPRPRSRWRFVRAADSWERHDVGGWLPFVADLRTTSASAVQALCWTDDVEADRGSGVGDDFAPTAGVSGTRLRVRYKPVQDRLADGGLPAVPRLPAGASLWRYLSLEPPDLDEPDPQHRPAWTIEGRLLPPPDEAAIPWPGRYGKDEDPPPPYSAFDDSVFAFNPAAQVWLAWQATHLLTVLARLQPPPDEPLDPALLDRVRQGIEHVRPAGVRTALALGETIV